jgi:hypothetical protein
VLITTSGTDHSSVFTTPAGGVAEPPESKVEELVEPIPAFPKFLAKAKSASSVQLDPSQNSVFVTLTLPGILPPKIKLDVVVPAEANPDLAVLIDVPEVQLVPFHCSEAVDSEPL